MMEGKTILAVVPARSGSKGVPHKNMRSVGGISLIGRAGICLSELPWLDAKVISTDSPEYAAEGERFGLLAPFLRPPELSSDKAGAVETVSHALLEMERRKGGIFDVILIIEPTSPLRTAADIENATRCLVMSRTDSVVTVSALPTKAHPAKVLKVADGRLRFYEERGAYIVSRQALETLYWRNGVCYAVTRECLLCRKAIFTENTVPLVIERDVVNIDDPIEFDLAEIFLSKGNR